MSAHLLQNLSQPSERWLPVPNAKRLFVSDRGRAVRFGPRIGAKIIAGWGVLVRLRGGSIGLSNLVYRSFVGPIAPGLEVNHIDGNRANNSVKNLEAITRLENNQHARRTGLYGRNIPLMRASGIDVEAVLAHDAMIAERDAEDRRYYAEQLANEKAARGGKKVRVTVSSDRVRNRHRPATPKSNQPAQGLAISPIGVGAQNGIGVPSSDSSLRKDGSRPTEGAAFFKMSEAHLSETNAGSHPLNQSPQKAVVASKGVAAASISSVKCGA